MVDMRQRIAIQSAMTKISNLGSKFGAALRSVFSPKRKNGFPTSIASAPITEADRYIVLYSRNKTTPYFGEDDEDTADGLILWS